MTFVVKSIEGHPLKVAQDFIDSPPKWFRKLDRFFLGLFTAIHNAIIRGHAKAKLRTLNRWVFDLKSQIEKVGLEMAKEDKDEGRELVRCNNLGKMTDIKKEAKAVDVHLSYCTSVQKASLYQRVEGLTKKVISQCDTHLRISNRPQVSAKVVMEF